MLRYLQCQQCRRFTTLWTQHESVPPACVWCGNRFQPPGGSHPVAGQTPLTLLSVADRLRNDVCRICGVVLSPRQAFEQTCDDPHCRAAHRQSQSPDAATRASQRLRYATVARAKARRWFRTAKELAPATGNLEWQKPGVLDVLLLPANTRGLACLPESRKQEFINQVESLVGVMRRDATHQPGTPKREAPGRLADEPSEPDPWGQSCAVCGGYCCLSGGTNAYLRETQIARYTRSDRGVELEDMVRAYASYLPAVSFQESCVYHAAHGCTLPLEMRSDVCHSFCCEEYCRVRQWFQAKIAVPVLLAAVADGKIHRLALFDGRRLHPVPVPSRADEDAAGIGSCDVQPSSSIYPVGRIS